MKYKIVKRCIYDKKQDPETKLFKLITHEQWGLKRKGILFGFWHDVGEELCDSQGNTFITQEWFDSYEIAQSYLVAWHEEHYKDDLIEIVDYEEKE